MRREVAELRAMAHRPPPAHPPIPDDLGRYPRRDFRPLVAERGVAFPPSGFDH